MDKYHLTEAENMRLHYAIKLPNKRRSLYEYLTHLPLEDLRAYPQKGYHWWMGRAARSAQALELRDYVLYWRLFALDFRKQYPREYLQTLSFDEMRQFVRDHIKKVPAWAYSEPISEALWFLLENNEPWI